MITCAVTLISAHLLCRVLEETAVRVEQKATRWESLSVVAATVHAVRNPCTPSHLLSALLSPQGAMGFPGMLGQKVRQ